MNCWKGVTRSHDSQCGADVDGADALWTDCRHAAGYDCRVAAARAAPAQFRHPLRSVVFGLDLYADSAVSRERMEDRSCGFISGGQSATYYSCLMGDLYIHDVGADCNGGAGARSYRNRADLQVAPEVH